MMGKADVYVLEKWARTLCVGCTQVKRSFIAPIAVRVEAVNRSDCLSKGVGATKIVNRRVYIVDEWRSGRTQSCSRLSLKWYSMKGMCVGCTQVEYTLRQCSVVDSSYSDGLVGERARRQRGSVGVDLGLYWTLSS